MMLLLSSLVTIMAHFGALAVYFGLFTPLLTVMIHKEFEYIGDIESKRLLGSVVKVWKDGEIAFR